MAAVAGRVDPELRAGLETFRSSWQPLPTDPGEFATFRAAFEEAERAAAATVELPAAVEIVDRFAPGAFGAPDVRVRLYHPAAATGDDPGLYFVHGGGMVLGLVETYDAYVCSLVEALGCVAASVDYRLAPESPHPAPVEDCYAGLVWFAGSAEELGLDPGRIAVYGRSAGGGLAAATMLIARDRRGPTVSLQMLAAPMLDDRRITPSSVEFDTEVLWSRTDNLTGWNALLAGRAGADDVPPYAAPARAEDLSGLPPAFVEVGELEVFRDECIDYARRLIAAGVPTELHVYPGAYHSFDRYAPRASVSKVSARAKLEALRRALRSG
jgi:acetyl esterase/lipase